MKGGVGKNNGVPSPAPLPSSAPRSFAHFSSSRFARSRSSPSDTSLPPSPSSAAGGTVFPTSVEDRKSSIAWAHCPPSAKRSRAFHRSLPLPVSSSTFCHNAFCSFFHLGHLLRRWSLVCLGHRHHQHCGVGRDERYVWRGVYYPRKVPLQLPFERYVWRGVYYPRKVPSQFPFERYVWRVVYYPRKVFSRLAFKRDIGRGINYPRRVPSQLASECYVRQCVQFFMKSGFR